MNQDEPIELNKERRLNHAINKLAMDEAPSRDLWPGIQSRIELDISQNVGENKVQNTRQKNIETKFSHSGWKNWAVAASLVLCVGSLSLSWNQLEKAEAIYAHVDLIEKRLVEAENESDRTNKIVTKRASYEPTINGTNIEYVRQIEAMETEFKVAKARLMARISMNQQHIGGELFKKIETDLLEIESATRVLKNAMIEQNVDTHFAHLLQATYEQELTVLTQLAKLDNAI